MATRRIPHPLPVAILGIVVGLILGYLVVGAWNDDRALQSRGRDATARVLDVRDRALPRSPRVEVEFTAEGRPVRQWVTVTRDGKPRVGAQLRVRYDPRDVDNTVDATRGNDPASNWFMAVIAALFPFGVPAAAWFVLRPARRALAANPELAERIARS